MSDYLYHHDLRLQNFTVFRDTTLEFVQGINVFVGENGTGKTHALKALYAAQLTKARELRSVTFMLGDLFQTKKLSPLIRMGTASNSFAEVSGRYGDQEWRYTFWHDADMDWMGSETPIRKAERPVFIPAIDMMGHTRGFLQASREIVLDFDLTCSDIVALLGLERRSEDRSSIVLEGMSKVLGGKIEYDENDGRFYLATAQGRLPMPLVAEGLRKISTLVRLAQNGWLTPGTSLFWDEPEVNLNPVLMDEVVSALLELARSGVQIFLATHSYVMLREIEVQSRKQDAVRYFAFSREDDGVTVSPANSYLEIDPNPIERQYADLYDRGVAKRMRAPK